MSQPADARPCRTIYIRFKRVINRRAKRLAEDRRLAPSPPDHDKIALLRSFDPEAPPDAEVPDPYLRGPEGFEEVLDLCEAACAGLVAHLRARHGL